MRAEAAERGGAVTAESLMALQEAYAVRASVWSDIVDHLPELHATVLRYPQARVLELGTRTGNSTAALLAATAEVGGHLWSVDVAEVSVPNWWAETGYWTLVLGNDLDRGVLDALPERVDVLFLDTSYAYDQTLAELRTYVPRVASGGTVLCHDTELEGPDPAFILPGGTVVRYPVARALDAFCTETGLTWENRPGCYGLGVLAVR